MKIYTKTGDAGETGLFGGRRVRKSSPRIEAIGAIDELAASLAVVVAGGPPEELLSALEPIQHQLFDFGAVLAAPASGKESGPKITSQQTDALEATIDRWEETLEPLREFILPGGCRAAAQLHCARAVCRRAERRVVELAERESISPQLVVYLNRLGDLLFVAARRANQLEAVADVTWRKE